MAVCQLFPDTVEEWMEEYKIVDTEHVYTNGAELVPIFRMKQWLQHERSLHPEQKWIPCSERLPEEGREVLLQWKVWKGINTDDDCFFAITHRSDYNYWTGIGREIIPVAWMPLPEQYKGGK